ncbi:MAG: hypothetical protein OEX08_01245 [Candidatus Nomurabacteria bacterium]|nr:hypothetical protein [Candidatus Nomurabacteria bacterium]
MKYKNNNQGFVILFAVLISSLILMIGFGIFSISSKEQIITSTARDAQIAFYAADSGLECVLFYEFQRTGFGRVGNSVDCGAGSGFPSQNNSLFEFDISYSAVNNSCAKIYLETSDPDFTTVISRGFNSCDGTTPDIGDPALVERAIQVTFANATS